MPADESSVREVVGSSRYQSRQWDREHFLLKPLGILNGKPLKPNEHQKKILAESVLVGEAMTKRTVFTSDSQASITGRTHTENTCLCPIPLSDWTLATTSTNGLLNHAKPSRFLRRCSARSPGSVRPKDSSPLASSVRWAGFEGTTVPPR